jgi:uracil-DNA glycosylase family 4
MAHDYDAGYSGQWLALCNECPDANVYPPDAFRTEWGPIFHRGRLDGSARVLVIGQDPGQHESVLRRILVGEAGQRSQGFLAKLGIKKSYVMINTFVYSLLSPAGGQKHAEDAAIVNYRNKWLDALLVHTPNVEAVIALGAMADHAFSLWKATQQARASQLSYQHITHPTEPISASKAKHVPAGPLEDAMLANWNQALSALYPLRHPDSAVSLKKYGTKLTPADDVPIPEFDMPPGIPPWMSALQDWAWRGSKPSTDKRATVTIIIPKSDRAW